MHGTDDHFVGFAIDMSTFRNPDVIPYLIHHLISISVIIVISVSILVIIRLIAFSNKINTILAVSLAIVITKSVKTLAYSLNFHYDV